MTYAYTTEKCILDRRGDEPKERFHVDDLISVKLKDKRIERFPDLRYKLENGWLIGKIESIDVDLVKITLDISREYNACKIKLDLLLDVEEIKSIGKANLKGEQICL